MAEWGYDRPAPRPSQQEPETLWEKPEDGDPLDFKGLYTIRMMNGTELSTVLLHSVSDASGKILYLVNEDGTYIVFANIMAFKKGANYG